MSSPASPLGGFLIGLAAFGWAADTLFRYPLMQAGFDPVLLVCIDHAICLVFLLPYFWIRHRGQLTSLSRSQWLGLFVIGAGASGIATVLFTASFALVNPSVAILIQKLQPVFVIFFAFLFLKERPSRSFYLWAPIALLSGLVISFSDFNFHFVRDLNPQSKGALYAFSAALIWALGTVIGKRVVGQISPGIVTYWRFQFGLLTLVVLYFAGRGSLTSFEIISRPDNLKSIGIISALGLSGMVIYYQGLVRTSASVATLMELIFPVSAVFLNTFFLNAPLKPVQVAASIMLVISVMQISTHPE